MKIENYGRVLLLGNTRFKKTPSKAESPIPAIVKPPNSMAAPPIPKVRINETMIRLRVSPRLVRFWIKLLMPTAAIVPNSSNMMPPNTAAGIDLSNALTFPNTEKTIPLTAAIRITAGSVIFVSEIAPVTSE